MTQHTRGREVCGGVCVCARACELLHFQAKTFNIHIPAPRPVHQGWPAHGSLSWARLCQAETEGLASLPVTLGGSR